MGQGLRCGVDVYPIPEGVKFLVIEHGHHGGGLVARALGDRESIHIVVDYEGVTAVYIDNQAHEAVVNPKTLADPR